MRLRQLSTAGTNAKALRKLGKWYAKQTDLASLAAAFDQFCKQAYWSRLWVIQEYAVAHDLKIVWGWESITGE
jgi:hypothetical protein